MEVFFGDGFVPMQVWSSPRQLGEPKSVFQLQRGPRQFRQTGQRRCSDAESPERRQDSPCSRAARVHVQEEIRESPYRRAPNLCKQAQPSACNVLATAEDREFHALRRLPVGGSEIEFRWSAPAADFLLSAGTGSYGHRRRGIFGMVRRSSRWGHPGRDASLDAMLSETRGASSRQ